MNQVIIDAIGNGLMWIGLGALLLIAAACAFVGFREVGKRLRARLCPVSLVVLASAAVIATCEAQKRSGATGTSRPTIVRASDSGAQVGRVVPIAPPAQSPRASATMPFRAAKWNVRGAWDDSFRFVFADGWEFPFGTGHLDRVEVCSQGRVIPRCGSADVIADVGVPLQVVPAMTTFGCGPTDRNSYIFAWTNAVVGRVQRKDVAGAENMDASIELFRNGDVEITTNGIARLVPRVHPSDLDGDGTPDVIDPNPSVCDGDFFGPCVDLPENANTNAYCWVDVVVANADAEVVFEGDGPSDLPDPHFMARAGATNRVTMLIGKGYAVRADERIECVGTSDMAIEVTRTGENALYIRWPVTITFEDEAAPLMRGGAGSGIARKLSVVPDCLGGEFEWASNHCCGISVVGLSFLWGCSGECGCGGCMAVGLYVYEGYRVEFACGNCGCTPHPATDGASPSVGVSFSEGAMFYEEAYTNSLGNVVGRRVSTNATFACTVYGGRHGGTFSLATANFGKLAKVGGDDLPAVSVGVAPYETRTWSAEYAPLVHSGGTNDITATAAFTETLSGRVTCVTAATTVVKLTLTPWVTRQGCGNRQVVGVRENIWCAATPDVGQWGETGGGELGIVMSSMSYKCPLTSDGSTLRYEVENSRYDFHLTIVEPSGLVARTSVARDFGVATNHAGGAGMNLNVYVLPETVAFNGIAMEEIPSLEGMYQGYFSNIAFSNLWYHTVARGAGKWYKVTNGNFVFEDKAWMGDEMPRELPNGDMTYDMTRGEWSEGLLVWDITWGWGTLNSTEGDLPAKAMTERYDQTFTFDEYGTLTVSKFQDTVSRGTNNVIRLNGKVVTGLPLTEEEINGANGND